MNFHNKIVLITGATGGLGTDVTKAFLEAGAMVAVTFTKEAKFQELQAETNAPAGKLFGVSADLLNADSVKSAVDKMVEKYGRIDALINLVGGFFGGVSVADMTEAQWEGMINLNLKSAFLICKNVFPVMMAQKSGRIINMGSKGGMQGSAGSSAYGAAKAGVINFTQALAAEGSAYNITANAVTPGVIDTAANRAAIPKGDFSKWVTPASLANVILFLCSEEAGDINGAIIPVFGKA